jgi:hypothetical protein
MKKRKCVRVAGTILGVMIAGATLYVLLPGLRRRGSSIMHRGLDEREIFEPHGDPVAPDSDHESHPYLRYAGSLF